MYNRKKQLNKQGTALVQVECTLNSRKIYIKTNLYLRPEHWNKECAQVYNHPHSEDLNTMLFEFILHLQGIELSFLETRYSGNFVTIEGYNKEA